MRRVTACLLSFALVCLLRAAAAEVRDVAALSRGDQGLRGLAPGALPAKPELRWTFKTGGPVKSSAVLAGDRVFVGSDDGHVYALALATGRKEWAFKTGGEVEAPPLVLNDVVYVGSADGWLYALKAQTGELQWKYQTGDKILGGANWFRTTNAAQLRIMVGSYDNKLHGVDAVAGKAVWAFDTSNYVNGTPAVAAGRVVFGGCDGQLHVLDAVTGRERAAIAAGAYVAGSPAVDGDFACAGHFGEEVLGVDLAAAKVLWRSKLPRAAFFASPALTDRDVLIGGRDKRLYCLDRATGKTRWTFATQGDVDSSPVVCGDRVVFGSNDGRLYVVRLDTGRLVWSYELGRELAAAPAVADGWVVIGSQDGNVYGFAGKRGN